MKGKRDGQMDGARHCDHLWPFGKGIFPRRLNYLDAILGEMSREQIRKNLYLFDQQLKGFKRFKTILV